MFIPRIATVMFLVLGNATLPAQRVGAEQQLRKELAHLDERVRSLKSLEDRVGKARGDHRTRLEKTRDKLAAKIVRWLTDPAHLGPLEKRGARKNGWVVVYLGDYRKRKNSIRRVARYLVHYTGKDPDEFETLSWSLHAPDRTAALETRSVVCTRANHSTPILYDFPIEKPRKLDRPLPRPTQFRVHKARPWDVVWNRHPGGPLAFSRESATLDRGRADRLALGFKWLRDHQSADGRWDADSFMENDKPELGPCSNGPGSAIIDVATTGLAVRALLQSPDGTTSNSWDPSIRRGLEWLIRQQNRKGLIGFRKWPRYHYGHAIATLALAEANRLGPCRALRRPLQRATQYILASQNPYAAWRYSPNDGNNGTSISCWMLAALRAAQSAGVDVTPRNVSWGLQFIARMTDFETGRTGNSEMGAPPLRMAGKEEEFPATNVEPLTAAAAAVDAMWSQHRKGAVPISLSLELFSKKPPVWEPERGSIDMLYWYWGSMALSLTDHKAGKTWRKRLDAIMNEFMRTDGNFSGSFDPIGAWGEIGGRVYSTAMMLLAATAWDRD